ncbi:MAG: cadherin repeat domain-containing protein [Deltaproteobacteria bacterium]|nr:MAG: cadherin repeat domain-containing protein [Deltaproteobacteria bacterium]
MRRSLPLLVLLPLVFACSSDRKAPVPAPPTAGNVVSPAVQPGGGSLVGGGGAQAPGASVRNSSPEIRGIRFVGGDGRPGNTLGVEAEGYDADGDPVQFEIAWQKNGQPAGTGNRLTAPVKRGDKVTMTITPFDGKDRGISATLSREILNTPPAIEGQEQFQVSDNVVTFHVRASDADGDPLTFSLKEAPAGMSIDHGTGWVRWVTSPGTTGKAPFTVVVSDGSGGESTARFTVTVAEQPSTGAR